jgi:capsular polysaccharide biosynthesis protein
MELTTALAIIGRRIWLVALCIVASAGAAVITNSSITPSYEASTTLAVNQLSPDGALTAYDNLLANELLAKTYAETIRSRPVLAEAGARLGLDQTPGELREQIEVMVVPETQLLRLIVTAVDPQRAADIANTLVVVFREQNQALLTQRYATARQGLEAELELAKRELDEGAGEVDELRAARGDAPDQQLRDAETALNRARNTYAALSEALASVRIAETQAVDTIDVIEVAYPPGEPVWPRPALTITVASLAGALIGTFIALLTGGLRQKRDQ